jgi:hypothetical protein
MDAFRCNQCGGLYDSEKELREHQQAVHHVAGYPPAATEDVDYLFMREVSVVTITVIGQ